MSICLSVSAFQAPEGSRNSNKASYLLCSPAGPGESYPEAAGSYNCHLSQQARRPVNLTPWRTTGLPAKERLQKAESMAGRLLSVAREDGELGGARGGKKWKRRKGRKLLESSRDKYKSIILKSRCKMKPHKYIRHLHCIKIMLK